MLYFLIEYTKGGFHYELFIQNKRNLIEVELDGHVVKDVKFTGGCNGNLKAIPKLVQGLTVEQVEEKLSGISCSGRPTSCGDQLAKACRAALEAQNA